MLVRRPNLGKVGRLIGYQPRFTLTETLGQIIEEERRNLGAAPERRPPKGSGGNSLQ